MMYRTLVPALFIGLASMTTTYSVEAQEAGGPGLAPARYDAVGYRSPRAGFAVRVGDRTVSLRVLAVTIGSGEEIEIAAVAPGAPDDLRVDAAGGRLRSTAGVWNWRAPEHPGFHAVRVTSAIAPDTIALTFMVTRPMTQVVDEALNGYAIGSYKRRGPSQSEAYQPPPGLIEVGPSDEDLLVSPNFTLGQFLCKQPGNPRYALVTIDLLRKLEALLSEVRDAGHRVPTLTVMSGFRTPAYNRAIGNTTVYSRHLWGDAADVFVDADQDGQMDDLNGDGSIDRGDANVLAGMVERLMERPSPRFRPGGLAVYRRNAAHGPFLHVDARGVPARW